MAFNFKDGFNKFADASTKLNRGLNNAIGKDIFNDVKPIEEEKEFPPLTAYPQYTIPEPDQLSEINGVEKTYKIGDSQVVISSQLDSLYSYRQNFKVYAGYYIDMLKFRYSMCVKDYDSLTHYFPDLYREALKPIADRAYSLLLPFGIFNVTADSFLSTHIDTFNEGINAFFEIAKIEIEKNQRAQQMGNALGNSIQMQGGGFGMKGAMKGMAQAEAFNIGLGLLGKFAEHQKRMTQEEKAVIFSQINPEILFSATYNDYYNVFLTLVNFLSDNRILNNVKTVIDVEFDTIYGNLQNPMFPAAMFPNDICSLISNYPFEQKCFDLLVKKMPTDDGAIKLVEYYNSKTQ